MQHGYQVNKSPQSNVSNIIIYYYRRGFDYMFLTKILHTIKKLLRNDEYNQVKEIEKHISKS